MVLRMHTRRLPSGLPPAGSRAIFVGDSITDPVYGSATGGGHKWAAQLAHAFGWVDAGGNMLINASFETDASSWTAAGATLTSDATHAQFGTKAMKIAMSSTSVIVNPEADSGAMRLGFQTNIRYTVSAYFWVPTANTGTIFLQILDGTPGVYAGTTVAITAANSWQRVSATRLIPNTATEAFVRIAGSSVTAAQAIWVDGAQLEVGSSASTWQDTANNARPSVSGSVLQTTSNFGANFLGNLATRWTPFLPVDVVVCFMGTNDLGTGVAGSPTPFTRATWATAVEAALQLFTSQNPAATVILLSLGGQLAYNDATAVTGWGVGSTRAEAYADMNAITQQLCRDYGAVFVSLANETAGMMTADNIHPNLSGHTWIAGQVKAAFGL